MQGWIQAYVEGLSPAEFHLQAGILFIILCFILYSLYSTHHRFRFIADTPTSKIASAAQGYVELTGLGELMPGSTINSPFSQSRCLWYQCIIEKRRQLNDTNWVQISNETSDELFHLSDETGVCVILPEGAVVMPSEHHVWYGHSEQARYQQQQKKGWWRGYLGTGKYRFTEKLIRVADPLYVVGLFETHQKIIQPDTFNRQVEALIQTWRNNPQKHLSAFDLDKNGKIQQREWIDVRHKAESIVRAQQSDDDHHLMKKPQHKSQPFVISSLPEQQLLNKKRLQIFFHLAIFFLLLYVLLSAINAHNPVTQF